MKRYYIEKSKMDNFLKEITAAQQKTNIFANVSVNPYRGKKYDTRYTVVVVVGLTCNTLYKPVGKPLTGFLYAPMFIYPRHSSRRIRSPEPPKWHCTICITDTGLYYAVCIISNFSAHFI